MMLAPDCFVLYDGEGIRLVAGDVQRPVAAKPLILSALLDGEISILVAFATKIVKQHP